MLKRGQTKEFSLHSFQRKNRKGLFQASFGWIFAIMAGIVIVFFAIYLSTKIIHTEQETVSAKTGKEIGILLDPLETSFESAQTTSITIPAETRMYNSCELTGTFGRQRIRLEQKSFNKWTQTDINAYFNNKYIFSGEVVEGKEFYIFSKPFSFPFKIADLIYMTSSNNIYCFIDPPSSINDEISNLNEENLLAENCSEDDINVCFGGVNCDININYENGYVEKDNKKMYFEGDALMYAAIFSDKDVYECQLKRLMLRLKELSLLYKDKELFIGPEISGSNLGIDLNELSRMAGGLQSSEGLKIVKMKADDINEKNEARRYLLW